MTSSSDSTDRVGPSSPWPVLVVLSELGIAVDLLGVGVVGRFVLSGSGANLLRSRQEGWCSRRASSQGNDPATTV